MDGFDIVYEKLHASLVELMADSRLNKTDVGEFFLQVLTVVSHHAASVGVDPAPLLRVALLTAHTNVAAAALGRGIVARAQAKRDQARRAAIAAKSAPAITVADILFWVGWLDASADSFRHVVRDVVLAFADSANRRRALAMTYVRAARIATQLDPMGAQVFRWLAGLLLLSIQERP